MGLLTAVVAGFGFALLAPGLTRLARGASGWILALGPLALLFYFGSFLPQIAAGSPLATHISWVPQLGVSLAFRLDGLSLLFALLICGMGAIVFVYAGGYLAGHPQLGRMNAFLMAFMASMLGVVLSDNAILLFVFWELTGLTSYLLIGFHHERQEARASALQALLVTGGGGLALLAGLLLLGQAGGSFEFSTLIGHPRTGQADGLANHAFYTPALLLILLGAFTKSAQFPFHFWLPAAMEAPTPVSAYLHSATMVKAGIYLLARLSPIFAATDVWIASVAGAGMATMLIGSLMAVVQTDLKRILAYSTVSSLGTLTLLLGFGGESMIPAAIAYLIAHALYKGALFLIAGAIDHETGTRDVEQLGGLFRAMPVTAVAAGVAALSMAGLIPLLGFIAKELLYEAALQGPWGTWLIAALVAANVLTVAAAALVGLKPFWGRRRSLPKEPHEAPVSLWLGPVALGGLGVAAALRPDWVLDTLVSVAGAEVLGSAVLVHLKIWHGFNTALALSAFTFVAGIGVYAVAGRLRHAANRGRAVAAWGPAGWYALSLKGMTTFAEAQTRFLQSGYLRYYLLVILCVLIGLTGAALSRGTLSISPGDWSEIRFYDVGLVLLIVPAALAAVLSTKRLAAIAALGVVGYGVALIFVLFGAPDVAMTQFLVETLTVIVFVLVFYHLPEPAGVSEPIARVRDAVIAAAVGTLMAILVLTTNGAEKERTVSRFYTQHSLPEAHGRNVVNVILVDFRGLDTLGEITVLAVAGLGVFALLKLRPRKPGDRRETETSQTSSATIPGRSATAAPGLSALGRSDDAAPRAAKPAEPDAGSSTAAGEHP